MAIVVAVASGKGGTGRTLLTGNMSLLLATLGKRVVAVDAAPSGSGLHGLFGIGEARRGVVDALAPGGPELAELVTATAVPGLGLVPGEPTAGWRGELDAEAAARIATQARALDVDYVLIDLPAGCSRYALDLFLAADVGVLVLVPEPPAIELGYRFLRAAFARRLECAGRIDLVAEGLPWPLELYERAPDIRDHLLDLRAAVILNCVRSKSDMDVARGIATAAGRRLGLPLRNLGHIDYDDAVWVSLRRRRALLVEHPEARASKCIEKVTRRLLARDAEPPADFEPGRSESYYQLLEIEPTASDEDIRRAHRLVRHLYGRDSVVGAGLWNREEIDALQRRFDEAYATLMDPARRRQYDLELFPEGIPASARSWPRRARPESITPPRPAPEIAPDADLNGPFMRELRESMGIELREISERTKISTAYLGAIEGEEFERLPAPVYVRGFLVEYAKMLGLDVTRVLETYFQRFCASRGSTTS
ncbi:MAG TPA: helix-turn-helix domain-containing protein [Kofleriaceae bacterium]